MNGWQTERQMKHELARAILHHQEHVRGGNWLLLDGFRAERVADRRWVSAARELARAARATSWRKAALGARRLLAAPMFVNVPGAGRAGRVQLTKDAGLIGFDDDHHEVWHLRRTPLPPHYELMRASLSKVYPNPAWSLSTDSLVLREDMVVGEPASTWGLDQRRHLLLDLLRIAAGRAGSSDADVRPPLEAIGEFAAEVAAVGDRWAILIDHARSMRAVPWIVSHGDVTPENVIGHDGGWQMIDFEDMRRAPFFQDALSLVVFDADLIGDVTEGRFDEAWGTLLDAAKVSHEELPLRLTLELTAVLTATYHGRAHGGRIANSLQRFQALVKRSQTNSETRS